MNKISIDDIGSHKTSDTLVIYGCSYFIQSLLKNNEYEKLSLFDSIGFNWFCKSLIPTTFYLVREQANIKKRLSEKQKETPDIFIESINKNPYLESILLIMDLSIHSPHAYPYHSCADRFNGSGVILTDLIGGNSKDLKQDMSKGLYHGRITLCNILHFAVQMKYKRILFAGIDLDNSRYFWLGNKPRHTITRKGIKTDNRHPAYKPTIDLLKDFRNEYDIELFSLNRKSLLCKTKYGNKLLVEAYSI